MATKKKTQSNNRPFKVNDYIVYPAHGVGKITGIEQEVIAGFDIEVYVVAFEQDKMTLRVPTAKAETSGMRALSGDKVMKSAMATLKGKPKVKRTMWSRRAQEYESKINSGDLILIAEVVRDLHRTDEQPEQSYSERQLYEAALDRLVREVSASEDLTRDKAMEKVMKILREARMKQAKAAADAEEADDEAAAA